MVENRWSGDPLPYHCCIHCLLMHWVCSWVCHNLGMRIIYLRYPPYHCTGCIFYAFHPCTSCITTPFLELVESLIGYIPVLEPDLVDEIH